MNQIRSIKGTHDILPAQSKNWQDLENQIHKTANLYGYEEIRTPIIENAALFNRGVGQETDVVSKEMYSWDDKDKLTISLRPEMTASVVRSYIQHNLGINSLLQRLYYIGPSFRRERPQKGRQRQFHHHQFRPNETLFWQLQCFYLPQLEYLAVEYFRLVSQQRLCIDPFR